MIQNNLLLNIIRSSVVVGGDYLVNGLCDLRWLQRPEVIYHVLTRTMPCGV